MTPTHRIDDKIRNIFSTDYRNLRLRNTNIRSFFSRDRVIFILCVAVALVFWILNRLSSSVKKNFSVDIVYQLPGNKAFSEPPTQNANVTISGSGWDILTHRLDKLYISINEDSLQTFSLRGLAAVQFGGDIQTIEPEVLSVTTENAVEKLLPVEQVSHISFAKGYDLSEKIQTDPEHVRVTGPKQIINNLVSVKTDTVFVKNLKDIFTYDITLSKNPLLRYNFEKVRVTMKAEQFTEKSLFIPIVLKNAPEKIKIFPNKIRLDCTVTLNHYSKVTAEDFIIEVDMRNATPNSKNNTLPLMLVKQPDWARGVKFSPKSVEFYLEK